ncbi:hypothetical protein [Cyclobacterium plantarum]|uniref:Uncharacterized protein n=1 Tax=Cyclobacterium plantarum TaxID=2716263 RepID=A0ABX0HFR0_9BACT|nr:hypothetical protein [Cyclobacterium plantarum]NHE58987.1 hypothetical protein [Cyclobacterium plantarum]
MGTDGSVLVVVDTGLSGTGTCDGMVKVRGRKARRQPLVTSLRAGQSYRHRKRSEDSQSHRTGNLRNLTIASMEKEFGIRPKKTQSKIGVVCSS